MARPTKGERTRQHIVETVAPVFNERGYHATTLADLMAATGLEKGGIYNHFGSKDELALAAYDWNTNVLGEQIRQELSSRRTAPERLEAIVDVYRRFAHHPAFPGGCPTLNTAVESHGTDPRFRERAREVMTELLDTVRLITAKGVERDELAQDTDPDDVATVLVSGIEGGILLSELFTDPSYMDRATDHLRDYIRNLAPAPNAPEHMTRRDR